MSFRLHARCGRAAVVGRSGKRRRSEGALAVNFGRSLRGKRFCRTAVSGCCWGPSTSSCGGRLGGSARLRRPKAIRGTSALPDGTAEIAACPNSLSITPCCRSSSRKSRASRKDNARLLIADRGVTTGSLHHHRFHELPTLLQPGDLLVLNDTPRIAGSPARHGAHRRQGEGLFLRESADATWEMLRQTRGTLSEGEIIDIEPGPLTVQLLGTLARAAAGRQSRSCLGIDG